ncbi:3-deoxy-D-manno-octulosonate 8-phosphate phosphatase (KDO 8-P phosphatase) [Methylohalomonas lacus]|uniref:3-deoxy-D-manno-octulosonate 8-phosphate phosphatase KdsC n=1 Tax=Methylohalomonas lacus TaxID=398773 RepID=A0AAE3HL23_9GAMM|nr:3-deoxy-manno-octulosonate-8-phosphatase KdsC [Methylohalomonas lacus]MCS3904204.1 3-deoxy-D-manno-octulosonate 8-phosphate phosphatase (KDO 8-P phosphatase) [Methylohalomonas lacus]
MNTVTAKAERVRLAIFDVDGVLTDGRLILGDDGTEHKAFHVRDGLGLVLMREAGLKVAIISARQSQVTAERMAALGIEYVYQGSQDKAQTYSALLDELDLPAADTAYVGDDLVDLPVLNRAGLAVAVADAHPLVRERADFVTAAAGGRGAVREVCELILDAQQRLAPLLARYTDAAN